MDEVNKSILVDLMKKHGSDIKRIIYSYVNDEKIAEDLTQDTFVKVFKHLDTFNDQSNIHTWIVRIAINTAKDYLKSAFYRKITFGLGNKEEVDKKGTPETFVVKKAWNEKLLEHVLALPIKYKEVLILFYYKDLTVAEMSDILNKSPHTIKTRLRRAKDRLKKQMGEEEQEWRKIYQI
ncbi:sigma-70 family RNA polymerase sigma factor [Gracilibacillus sp. S3-1-1]|uniref:Sigma-70 family RNA polymerase sigma factor n=1 Tax=Gracilibacillus pellucidus TaxID=3095368 RepID=A0ACC6M879_9BACI|nr:sigma-70 family RNA polymerase sigma factor [Gracilibacillus sp. S3-1-1]MDX8047169.1 sigma-70 family RNA polymerase sigma factor [Gracilibacillus sp. S3-1-1]